LKAGDKDSVLVDGQLCADSVDQLPKEGEIVRPSGIKELVPAVAKARELRSRVRVCRYETPTRRLLIELGHLGELVAGAPTRVQEHNQRCGVPGVERWRPEEPIGPGNAAYGDLPMLNRGRARRGAATIENQ
jgi:hypothetical protein